MRTWHAEIPQYLQRIVVGQGFDGGLGGGMGYEALHGAKIVGFS